MTEKVTFRISAAAAPYVGADKPRQNRLQAASGEVELPPADLVLLLYYLCNDADEEVKRRAAGTLRGLDAALVSGLLLDPELHPRLLDVLAQLHGTRPELGPLFLRHPNLSEKAAAWLASKGICPPASEEPDEACGNGAETETGAEAGPVTESEAEAAAADAEAEDEELDEAEFQSKYQMAQAMGVSERIKMAMTGDKEWRTILIKDTNKLVSGAAIKNPRMTEAEVLAIAKSAVQNDEIMRVICSNKEWIKNPLIRKALVENNKTPLPYALRFITTLNEKDLSALAKSKNVSSVVASQARRILMNKKDSR